VRRCGTHHGHPADGASRLRAPAADGQRSKIYVKKDAIGDAGYELWKLLDLGDHIGVPDICFAPAPRGEYSCGRTDIFGEGPAAPAGKNFHGPSPTSTALAPTLLDLVMNPEDGRSVF